jgi:dTDP-4-dehydrorhamnose reductase
MHNYKIIVLGPNGMLGQMVCSYFTNNGFDVIKFEDRFEYENHNLFIEKLNNFPDSIIINCIGKIKQKSDNSNELLFCNSILPLELNNNLKESHILIQPSTDCVFNGLNKVFYNLNDKKDAIDVYGWSKSLGESAIRNRKNSLVIRVSIIGIDQFSDKGLLSWFLNNIDGDIITGFVDHYWNGITTLEWCKILHTILLDTNYLKKFKSNLLQLGTNNSISKYELLNIFQKIFLTNYQIKPYSTNFLNRCLLPSLTSENIEIQLKELKMYCEENNLNNYKK